MRNHSSMNRLAPPSNQRPGWFSRTRSAIHAACQFFFLLAFLCLPALTRADVTYGALLDKQFEHQPTTQGTNEQSLEIPADNSAEAAAKAAAAAKIADFERSLKERAAKVELGPPPPPPPNVNLGVTIMIGVAVFALLGLKALFIISRVRTHQEAKAIAREEQFIKTVVQEPTVASLLSDLKHSLEPTAEEILPEAHAAVCSTELKKANDKGLIEAAIQVFESAPLLFAQLRKRFAEISHTPDVASQLKGLEEFSQEIRPSRMAARIPALRTHRLLAIAIEGFLKQLAARSKNLTPWRLQLVSESLELFEDLCVPNLSPDLATNPAIRILVVDDCAVSRHAMVFALKKVFHEPDLAEGGKNALELIAKNTYDVIFLDIEMPGMDGLELCEKIRATGLNKKTPIIFVTGHDSYESRTKIVKKGAQDLIGKPYLPTEITLKALQVSLYGRLKLKTVEPLAPEPATPAPVPALAEAAIVA
jgi:CheY-like chemotaxis protein